MPDSPAAAPLWHRRAPTLEDENLIGNVLPLNDVAAAGGWKDVSTLLEVYQQSDEESVLAVTSVTVKLRKRSVAKQRQRETRPKFDRAGSKEKAPSA